MRLKKRKMLQGSITTYVIIMFGLVAVMYLMGFTNMWSQWNATTDVSSATGVDTGISDPGAANPLFQPIKIGPIEVNPIYIAIISIFGLQFIIAKLSGASGAITFVIPLALIILFANIFIFPVVPLTEKMSFIPASIPITVILLAFFNLWLILAVIEWIRG